MFKIQDCFLKSGVFNEALIKRFKENYDPKNGSRLWMIPGHIIYTASDHKIYTCDARPLDLLSPNEPGTGELISTNSKVLEIFFDSEARSLRMYVVLANGDVQIFEYRSMLYEWARVGYFNLNITSPNNTSSENHNVDSAFISPHQKVIYWTEISKTGDMNRTLFKRTLPLNVREITQTAIGPSQILFTNCPYLEFCEMFDNVVLVPRLPNCTNLYLVLSGRSHLWVFDISGKCLWRGIINEQSMDFLSLCLKVAGLWTQGGHVRKCVSLQHHQKMAYLFHDNILLFISSSGEINKKVMFELSYEETEKCFVLWNILCVFTKDHLKLYNLSTGKLSQVLNLENHFPIIGLWSYAGSLPCLGFYTESTIYMLQPQSLLANLNSKDLHFSEVLNVLSDGNILIYTLMKDLVYSEMATSDLVPLPEIPNVLQSQALLLSLIELCKTKGIDTKKFPFSNSDMDKLFGESDNFSYPDTKLNKILQPLVECYCKIENAKKKL